VNWVKKNLDEGPRTPGKPEQDHHKGNRISLSWAIHPGVRQGRKRCSKKDRVDLAEGVRAKEKSCLNYQGGHNEMALWRKKGFGGPLGKLSVAHGFAARGSRSAAEEKGR